MLRSQGKLVFVFPGEGSQYADMGAALYKENVFFRHTVDACKELFAKSLSYENPLYAENFPLATLFTLEYSLAKLWLHWGLKPDAVIGHSDGEYAAATIAGILTLEDAVKLIITREKSLFTSTVKGGMYALNTTEEEIKTLSDEMIQHQIAIAAINSNTQYVVSGEESALAAFIETVKLKEIKHTRLPISHPFHSPLLNPASETFYRELPAITYAAPAITYVSGLKGSVLADGEMSNTYWQEHMIAPVRFKQCINVLENLACKAYLEVGPKAQLSSAIQQSMTQPASIFSSLDDQNSHQKSLSTCLRQLNQLAIPLNWTHIPSSFHLKLPKPTPTLFQPKQQTAYEPIAIIGYSCRLPGNANHPDALWDLLENKRHGISEIDPERWDMSTVRALEVKPPLRGGFIQDIDKFDAEFFGVREAEAILIDPQQRLLTETTWEALEHAGIIPSELSKQPDRNISICMGLSTHDYGELLSEAKIGSPLLPIGNAFSAAAGRIAMYLGVQGPTFAVDSACSSSIVAIHTAIQHLHTHHADIGIAGAANLVLAPQLNSNLTRAGMLAPDASCKVFDKKANGYARSEGVGVVILKRLNDAIRDKDIIHGVIRATNISQDGERVHLSAPNTFAQQRLLKRSLEDAALSASDIDYYEAHGTGTPLGDPTEAMAVATIYQSKRATPLRVGSIKSNIGHTETTAGMAGLFKILLAFKHNAIPPNVNLQTVNPEVAQQFAKIPADILVETSPWPRTSKPRYAALSAFGFTGTISHMILEEPPIDQNKIEVKRPLQILTISAKTEDSLQQLLKRYAEFCKKKDNVTLAEMAFTANTKREHFPYRIALVAKDKDDLLNKIERRNYLVGKERNQPPVTFMFTGQGSQYLDMAVTLFKTNDIFKNALVTCFEKFKPYIKGEDDLITVLFGKQAEKLNQTFYTQTILFAIEYALAQVWLSWNVKPTYLVGHSVGEFVACVIAGVISLDDAIKLVFHRGKLMQDLESHSGCMWALSLEASEGEGLIKRHNEANPAQQIDIAAYNSERQIVISGEKDHCDAFIKTLNPDIKVTSLKVSHAFHSRLMQPMIDRFRAIAKTVAYQAPSVAIISTLYGRELQQNEINADYWCTHILQPVKFFQAMAILKATDCKLFIEIGPRPILSSFCKQSEKDPSRYWLATIEQKEDNWQTILRTLAQLYVEGVQIDWEMFDNENVLRMCELPTYAFQKKRHWPAALDAGYPIKKDSHPLLGNKLSIASTTGNNHLYQGKISRRFPEFILDHKLYDVPVLAGAAYLSAIYTGCEELFPDKTVLFEKIEFKKPILFANHDSVVLQTHIQKIDDHVQFSIHTQSSTNQHEDQWTLHVKGTASLSERLATSIDQEMRQLLSEPTAFTRTCSKEEIYAKADALQLQLGDKFRWLEKVYISENKLLGKLRKPTRDEKGYSLHPGLIDSCFQTCLGLFIDHQSDVILIPVECEGFSYFAPGELPTWVELQFDASQSKSAPIMQVSLRLFSEDATLLGSFEKLQLRAAPKTSLLASLQLEADTDKWLYELQWKQDNLPKQINPALSGKWLIIGPENALTANLKAGLSTHYDKAIFEHTTLKSSSLTHIHYTNYHGIIYLESFESTEGINALKPLMNLMQTLSTIKSDHYPKLWVITKDSAADQSSEQDCPKTPLDYMNAVIGGFVKSMTVECPQFQPTQIDLSSLQSINEQVNCIVEEIGAVKNESLVVFRQQHRLVPRLTRCKIQGPNKDHLLIPKANHYRIVKETDNTKTLASAVPITIAAQEQERILLPTQVLVNVKASSLNYRDALNAIGEYPGEAGELGLDFAGVIAAVGAGVSQFKPGDSILGMSSEGCFATQVAAEQARIIHKPSHWNFEEAAGIPTVYLTAYYALVNIANIQPGENVLIHSAAGGVGLAAIALAKHFRANIFATAGSTEKRQYLNQLGIKQVMDSRNPHDFPKEILERTRGKGVDIVLNFLTGEHFIQGSLRACAPGARFIEIGKRNIWTKEQVAAHRKDIEYTIFALDTSEDSLIQTTFSHLQPLFNNQSLPSLPHTIYPIEKAILAFQKMLRAQHIGKIVFRITPAFRFEKEASYLITGGLGGIGQYLCELLVNEGVASIILVGRKAASVSDLDRLSHLAQGKSKIITKALDIANTEAVTSLLTEIKTSHPPLKGIFHAAGILRVDLIKNQTWETFNEVFAPKITGTLNLHHATEALGISLDHFVLFSSIVSIQGGAGQSNYAAANAFLDMFAAWRRQQGKPAISINWGAWAKVGMAAETLSEQALQKTGIKAMQSSEAMQAFSLALASNLTQIAIADVDWQTFMHSNPQAGASLEMLLQEKEARQKSKRPVALIKLLAALPTQEARTEKLQEFILEILATHFQLQDISQLNAQDSFNDIGLDSLSTENIRASLQQELGNTFTLNTIDFAHHSTAAAMANYILDKLTPILNSEASQKPATTLSGPLFPTQENLYAREVLYPNNSRATRSAVLTLSEPIDETALKACLQFICKHFYILQNQLAQQDDNIAWKLSPDFKLDFEITESSIEQELSKPLSMDSPTLIRFRLIKHKQKNYFMVTAHSSILDSFSFDILFQALSHCYQSYLLHQPLTLTAFPNQYENIYYTFSHRKDLLQPALSFWRDYLSDLTISNYFGEYYKKSPTLGYQTKSAFLSFSETLSNQCQSLCKQENIDMHTLAIGSLSLLIFQISGQSDIVIATPQRSSAYGNAGHTVGGFETALPLRTQISTGSKIKDFLSAVISNKNAQQMNSAVFPSDLLHALEIYQDIQLPPLHQVGLQFIEVREVKIGNIIGIRELALEQEHHTYPLFLKLYRQHNQFHLQVDYNSNRFTHDAIVTMAKSFIKILESMLNSLDKTIQSIINPPAGQNSPARVFHNYSIDSINIKNALLRFKDVHVREVAVHVSSKDADPKCHIYVDIGKQYQLTLNKVMALLKNLALKEFDSEAIDKIFNPLSVIIRPYESYTLEDVLKLNQQNDIFLISSAISNIFFKYLELQFKKSLNPARAETITNSIKTYYQQWVNDKSNLTTSRHLLKALSKQVEFLYHGKLARDMRSFLLEHGLPHIILPENIIITDGHLEPLIETKTAADLPRYIEQAYVSPNALIETMLTVQISQLLGRQVKAQDNLLTIPGVVLEPFILRLLQTINKGRLSPINLSVILKHPTIAELTEHLSQLPEQPPTALVREPIFPITPAKNKPALFLIHPATGLAHAYRSLQKHLENETVMAIHDPRITDPLHHFQTLEEMAAEYVKLIQEQQPKGPYRVGGWSFGGNVAYEIAQQLKEKGEIVEGLFLFDSFNLPAYAGEVQAEKILQLTQIQSLAGSDISIRREIFHNMVLNALYQPKPYTGRVILFRACVPAEPFTAFTENIYNGWDQLISPSIRIVGLPCNHYEIFYRQFAEITAGKIKLILNSDFATESILQKNDIPLLDRHLLFAARHNDTDLIALCLKAGANPSSTDFFGRNTLHWLAQHGNELLIDLVLQQPANYQQTDYQGSTPLDLARIYPNIHTKMQIAARSQQDKPLNPAPSGSSIWMNIFSRAPIGINPPTSSQPTKTMLGGCQLI